jgi:hypothetical protein
MTADPGRWAREVVARRALAVSTATALVHAAVVIWALPPTLEAQAPVAVGSVIDLLGVLVLVLWSRTGVTPADPALAPTAADGTPYLLHARGQPLPPMPDSAYPPGSVPLPVEKTLADPPNETW